MPDPTIRRKRFALATALLEQAREVLWPGDDMTIIVAGPDGMALQSTLGSRAAMRGMLADALAESLVADGKALADIPEAALHDFEAWAEKPRRRR